MPGPARVPSPEGWRSKGVSAQSSVPPPPEPEQVNAPEASERLTASVKTHFWSVSVTSSSAPPRRRVGAASESGFGSRRGRAAIVCPFSPSWLCLPCICSLLSSLLPPFHSVNHKHTHTHSFPLLSLRSLIKGVMTVQSGANPERFYWLRAAKTQFRC